MQWTTWWMVNFSYLRPHTQSPVSLPEVPSLNLQTAPETSSILDASQAKPRAFASVSEKRTVEVCAVPKYISPPPPLHTPIQAGIRSVIPQKHDNLRQQDAPIMQFSGAPKLPWWPCYQCVHISGQCELGCVDRTLSSAFDSFIAGNTARLNSR